jgi:RNA polymerase sigma factor (sigma-70 family)
MDEATDAVLVERVRRGDPTAFAPLFERWYDRAYNVARGVVRSPDVAADVTQDAFVTVWRQLDRLDDVNAFGGWLLRITRNRALDTLRREGRSRSTDDEIVTALHDRGLPSPASASAPVGPSEAAEVHEREQLLWAASAALGERDASILDLHLRHGLGPTELAADLGVTAGNAQQMMHRLRERLGHAIEAFLLWNRGTPKCSRLASHTSNVFDSATVKAVRRHVRQCDQCAAEQRRQTDPVKLFAAVPVVAAPLIFRSRAAFALNDAGVPMPDDLLSTTGERGGRSRRRSETESTEHGTASTADQTGNDPTAGHADQTSDPSPTASAPEKDIGAVEPPAGRSGSAMARLAVAAALLIVGTTALMVVGTRQPDSALRRSTALAPTTRPTNTAPPPSTVVVAATTVPTTTIAPTTAPTTSPTSSAPTTSIAEPPAAADPPPIAEPEPTPPIDPAPPAPPPVAPPPAPDQPAAEEPPPDPDPVAIDPPAIIRFVLATGAAKRCGSSETPMTARWLTEDADAVSLSWSGRSISVPTDGSEGICVGAGVDVTVTASNAGGDTTATQRTPSSGTLTAGDGFQPER